MLNQVSSSVLALAATVATTANAFGTYGEYAPTNGSCPSSVLVREASGLSANETAWLKKRDAVTQPILKEWLLKHVNDSSTQNLINSIYNSTDERKPRVAIAASGGGYRAMLSGAGMLSALDNRTTGANEHGLGGILQGSTYLAGLSGGNWLTSTLAFNDWISVQEIIDQNANSSNTNAIWDIENTIVDPYGIYNFIENLERFQAMGDAVAGKKEAGFDVSFNDFWGRALSYNFFPTEYQGGEAMVWSSLKNSEVFTNAEMPFVISVADGKYPGTSVINLNSTLFEFNPFEMGSWDPSLNAFVDVQYIGTDLANGTVVGSECVEGFDNVGFVLGTSSSLFNEITSALGELDMSTAMVDFLKEIIEFLTEENEIIAVYSPNPFYKTEYFNSTVSNGSISSSDTLYLADGGEDGEDLPLVPLVQKDREVDVIFALDNGSDTDDLWPSGVAMYATYARQFGEMANEFSFPTVPSPEVFVKEGLNTKPVFFGCNSTLLEDLSYIPPVVIYVPNSEYSFASNTETLKMSYTQEERLGMIQNGFEVMTRNNMTEDASLATCISCAVIKRSQERLGASISSECEKCYSDYCYN